MSSSLSPVPAAEGPYPMMGEPPGDQQQMDLKQALAMVDSMIWRDGGMDQQEMSIWAAWVQQTMMKVQAQQMAAQQGQGDPSQQGQQQGLGSSSATQDINPFGGPGGQDLEPAGDEAGPY
jgi:hypothetical protein